MRHIGRLKYILDVIIKKDDTLEWYRNLSKEFIKNSPSPTLRSCANLASTYLPLLRELFTAMFISCWEEIRKFPRQANDLIENILKVMQNPNCSLEVLNMLLNMFEFFEKHEYVKIKIKIANYTDIIE